MSVREEVIAHLKEMYNGYSDARVQENLLTEAQLEEIGITKVDTLRRSFTAELHSASYINHLQVAQIEAPIAEEDKKEEESF